MDAKSILLASITGYSRRWVKIHQDVLEMKFTLCALENYLPREMLIGRYCTDHRRTHCVPSGSDFYTPHDWRLSAARRWSAFKFHLPVPYFASQHQPVNGHRSRPGRKCKGPNMNLLGAPVPYEHEDVRELL